MSKEVIVIIVLAVLLAAALVTAFVLFRKYNAQKRRNEEGAGYAADVKVKDGVRYSKEEAVERDGKPLVGVREKDFVLARGQTYTAKKDTALMPGTYTVLAASENMPSFKLRVGGLVRTYAHGDTLVLADGEEICAVSCTAVLR